jgi:hypothetical protein|tara:strand:+ start:526 stop:738 length:213 start_codon:yes stop_codon:yes gene_type:complete
MTAQDRPTSKPNNQNFTENWDGVFKDPVKLGVSPSTEVENWDYTKPKCHADSLKSLEYAGDKIEPIAGDL